MSSSLESQPIFASLTAVVADWSASSHVTAFTSTRLGGVSQPPFESLNLGLHVGDDVDAVQENRRRLQNSFVLPSSPQWLNQTHATEVVSLTAQSDGPLPADGAYTDQADTVLAVLTADCLPVVISNTQGSAVSVVHAGWRGLAAGILENALAKFSPGDLHAWLGPAIGAKAFEVGEDVLQAFVGRNTAHETAFISTGAPGKYMADLYALARTELLDAGSVTVTGGDHCTFSQKELFHSHRRDGVSSGRMATIAWLDNRD